MLFSYKAVRPGGGGEYEGTLEAPDKFALYKEIHAKGDAVLSVHETNRKSVASSSVKKMMSLSWGGMKMTDRIMFAKNLSAMLRAGLPLPRALAVLERQMENKQWKKIFSAIQDDLAKGVALSVSLSKFPKAFNSLFVAMVKAGGESGSISDSLALVGEEMEKSYELKKKVRGAMIYPAIIIGLMLAIAVLMFVYVLPKLTATFKELGAQLPLATRIIINTSDFLQMYWTVMLIALVVLGIAFYIFGRSKFGKSVLHKIILWLPIVGTISKEVNAARTTRTLSSLLSSGISVVAAVNITVDVVQNVQYKNMLEKVGASIEKGDSIQSIFAARTDLYPSFVGEMIGVGEETGTLSKTLLEIATFYEDEVDQKTKNMSTVVEPVLMIIIGLGVGFFALAMISPIYSLTNAI
jgi:type IV pilus assembly protein PilC